MHVHRTGDLDNALGGISGIVLGLASITHVSCQPLQPHSCMEELHVVYVLTFSSHRTLLNPAARTQHPEPVVVTVVIQLGGSLSAAFGASSGFRVLAHWKTKGRNSQTRTSGLMSREDHFGTVSPETLDQASMRRPRACSGPCHLPLLKEHCYS